MCRESVICVIFFPQLKEQMDPVDLEFIENYRFRFVARTEQTIALGIVLPNVRKTTNVSVPDFVRSVCGITVSLVEYALTGETERDYSNASLEDLKTTPYGFYSIDYNAAEGYDHSFIVFINGDVSYIIQSYAAKNFLRQDEFSTKRLLELLEDIPANYNTLFFVDKPYHAEYEDINVTFLHLSGDIRDNLEKLPLSRKNLRFNNRELQPYGYAFVGDELVSSSCGHG